MTQNNKMHASLIKFNKDFITSLMHKNKFNIFKMIEKLGLPFQVNCFIQTEYFTVCRKIDSPNIHNSSIKTESDVYILETL